MIYTTLLNPALDVYFRTGALRLGETYTRLGSGQLLAGKGINVAKAIRALGEPSRGTRRPHLRIRG